MVKFIFASGASTYLIKEILNEIWVTFSTGVDIKSIMGKFQE
jgi:hypothetical protein